MDVHAYTITEYAQQLTFTVRLTKHAKFGKL